MRKIECERRVEERQKDAHEVDKDAMF